MIFALESCELEFNGQRHPLSDLSYSTVAEESSEPLPNVSREFTAEFSADELVPGFDITMFLKPTKVDIVFSGPWYGGTLTTWLGEATASQGREECSFDFEGCVRRFEWKLGAARVGWDPVAVSVAPCLKVRT